MASDNEDTQLQLDDWVYNFSQMTASDPQAKLQEEVDEFLQAETFTRARLEEAADVTIVLLTQLAYESFSLEDLLTEVHRKIGVNNTRRWRRDEHGVLHHIRT